MLVPALYSIPTPKHLTYTRCRRLKNHRAVCEMINSSARLSLGLIEHGNGFGRLGGKTITISLLLYVPPTKKKPFNAPHETTRVREIKRGTLLRVTPLFNTENREHSRGHNEQRRIDVVPPRADALSKPKHRCQCDIVPQCPVRIEKSLGLEDLGLRKYIRVTCYCPARMRRRHKDSLNTSYQIFPINQAPGQISISKLTVQ
jgi:hypothetical protein